MEVCYRDLEQAKFCTLSSWSWRFIIFSFISPFYSFTVILLVLSSASDHTGKLLLLEVPYLLVQYSSLFIFSHWIPADMFSEKRLVILLSYFMHKSMFKVIFPCWQNMVVIIAEIVIKIVIHMQWFLRQDYKVSGICPSFDSLNRTHCSTNWISF